MEKIFKKLSLFLIIFLSFNFSNFCEITTPTPADINIPSYKLFLKNIDFSRKFSYKKITIAEYITDPFIMYVSLWGCIGFTTLMWETNPGYEENTVSFVRSGAEYLERINIQPFSNDRQDLVMKPWPDSDNYQFSIFKGNVYAKNILEPAYFTQFVLYLRSKDYHPALVITELLLLSVCYEFTVRPFFLNLSFEQLIKNPAAAIVIGLFLDEISTFLLTTPYVGLHVLAYILNPYKLLPTARIRPLFIFKPYRKAVSLETIIKLE